MSAADPSGRGPASPRGTAVLVSAAASGDESAWAELVRRYAPLVATVIRSHGLDRADSADVNQTVWLRLVEQLGRLRDAHALPAWLVTTTRRECHRLLRLGRRTQPFDPYDDSVDGHVGVFLLVDPTTPDEDLLRAERRQALRDAFAQLPPRCRDLLALLAGDPPASYREVGERLGMPLGSVGPTQARCLARLRGCPALAPYVRLAPGGAEETGGERDGAVAARR
ncbi:RNA polymerase sigma factor [Micromonospora sagamiensis]|uniref:RNA polymerase sigma factor (Sigma-70 family) n=1 Tax=Micromonospora sagamiensis TaxID=47875 RepID=A0A562W8X8_9ACTN|nr:sigma-70 family RNA polymerase sigma factor [Micromonospora sagamiensis]TWJ26558.1 RNA polymerase sigma factor (sigma-70 family) [Micromonospora sagamiensis]BCL14557.1 RNA polymerase sigma factor [Micromonospora sagamiensis]